MRHEAYTRLNSLILELDSGSEENPVEEPVFTKSEFKEFLRIASAQGVGNGDLNSQQRVSLFRSLPQYLQSKLYGGSTILGSVLDKARKNLGLDRKTIVKSAL